MVDGSEFTSGVDARIHVYVKAFRSELIVITNEWADLFCQFRVVPRIYLVPFGSEVFILKLGGFQNGSTFKRAKAKALELIEEAKELKGLNDVRVAYLGKKSNYRSITRHGKIISRRASTYGSISE